MNKEYRHIALLSFGEYDEFRNCKLRFYDFPECEVVECNFLRCIDSAKLELGYLLWKAERERQNIPQATNMKELDLAKIKQDEQISVVVLRIDDFEEFDAQMEHKNFNKELNDKISIRFKAYLKKLGYTSADEDVTSEFYSEYYTNYMEGYKETCDKMVKNMLQANIKLSAIIKLFPGYSFEDLKDIKRDLINN